MADQRTHDWREIHYDPEAAVEWAQEVLSDPSTVLLDTETTGLRGYTCEIAVINVDGEPLVNTLILPPVPCEPGAQRVHKITAAELASARKFAVAWNAEIMRALTGKRIVVYNAEFDYGIIQRDLETAWPGRADELLSLLWSEWECLMLRRDQWTGERLRLGGGHRALGDCLSALDLLKEMAVPWKA